MRKSLLAAVFITATVTAFILLLWGSGRVGATIVRLNVKDIPEHDVRLITASDPSFDAMMRAYASIRSNAPITELRPFSVFIENRGKKTLVAYKMKWECLRADGVTIVKTSSEATTWILMNAGGANHQALVANATTVIRPNSIRFFSLAAPPETFDEKDINKEQSSNSPALMASNSAQTQEGINNPDQVGELRRLNEELKRYTDITVSLDGVFFDDGTFVGPNSTGFFEEIKAQVDARYDVLNELTNDAARAQAFQKLEMVANAPDVELEVGAPPAVHYEFYKRVFARELLSVKKSSGEDKARERARSLLNKPWPKLRKL